MHCDFGMTVEDDCELVVLQAGWESKFRLLGGTKNIHLVATPRLMRRELLVLLHDWQSQAILSLWFVTARRWQGPQDFVAPRC